jgi:hypothetical protein
MTDHEVSRAANGSCEGLAIGPFLLEPEVVEWLKAAARPPGQSLHVALALVFAGSGYSYRPIALPNLPLLEMKLDRCAKYRALVELERAGLVTVVRRVGRAPLVTISRTDRPR